MFRLQVLDHLNYDLIRGHKFCGSAATAEMD
jgi:hypothetical protein